MKTHVLTRAGLTLLGAGLMLLSLFLLTGCDEMRNAMLIYADGSGNVYRVTPEPKATISYDPIKPANSSSGTYDGGEPVADLPLNKADHDRILAAVRAAVLNRKVHIEDRVMMSGAVTIRQGDKDTNFILRPGCAEQKTLETALKDGLR